MNATIPFSILEMLIAHQTPVMPSPIAAVSYTHLTLPTNREV